MPMRELDLREAQSIVLGENDQRIEVLVNRVSRNRIQYIVLGPDGMTVEIGPRVLTNLRHVSQQESQNHG